MRTGGDPSIQPVGPVRRIDGPDAVAIGEQLAAVYAEAFATPPWHSDPRAGEFLTRLRTDATRPGFRAAVATSPAGVDGFATGWITQPPLRTDRAYPKVATQLGPQRVKQLLLGALEVDELAVRVRARRQGLGQRLLAELIRDAPDQRAWLLTAAQAAAAVTFYLRTGWHQVPPLPGTGNDVVVFLAPHHPAAATPDVRSR